MTPPPDSGQPARHWGYLLTAAACAALGIIVHSTGPRLPAPVATVGLGVGMIGAAFLLAWAADAGEAVFSGGLVLTAVALVAVLPEFTIEVHYAYSQRAGLVTANLAGATRLLLTGAVALPLLVEYLARRRGEPAPAIHLEANRELELGLLLVASLFAVQVVIRGALTIFDGIVLLGLYALYAWRVQGTSDEEPAVVGVAAGLLSLPTLLRRPAVAALLIAAGAVVLTIANPFADALLKTGTTIGISPYRMIQSVVPAVTEAPEFVVVVVLVINRRPAQGLAVFLASALSQWTLGIGALPFAYAAGGGGGGGGVSIRLDGLQQVELGLTIAVTLFAIAALVTLRLERVDALLLTTAFAAQLLEPTRFVRLATTFVLLVFAVDLFFARRSSIRPILRAGARGTSRSRGDATPTMRT